MVLHKPCICCISAHVFVKVENFVLATYNLAMLRLHKTGEGGGKMRITFLVISSWYY